MWSISSFQLSWWWLMCVGFISHIQHTMGHCLDLKCWVHFPDLWLWLKAMLIFNTLQYIYSEFRHTNKATQSKSHNRKSTPPEGGAANNWLLTHSADKEQHNYTLLTTANLSVVRCWADYTLVFFSCMLHLEKILRVGTVKESNKVAGCETKIKKRSKMLKCSHIWSMVTIKKILI